MIAPKSKNNPRNQKSFYFFSERDNHAIYLLGFLVFAFYMTAISNDFFLKWVERLSFFAPTSEYFFEKMRTAGGLLMYLGGFFTQSLKYPLLGGGLIVALLLGVQYLTVTIFCSAQKHYVLSFIPAFMLLLTLTQLGYVWVTLKSPGYFFSNILGTICFLFLFSGHKKILRNKYSLFVGVIIIFAGYPLLGFYALFVGIMALLFHSLQFLKNRKSQDIVFAAGYLVTLLLTPQVYFYFVYDSMPYNHLFIAGLPSFAFNKEEFVLWLPFLVLFTTFLFFLFFENVKTKKHVLSGKMILRFLPFIFIAFVFITYFMSYRNENFEVEIKMKEAIEQSNWRKVEVYATNMKGTPTRSIVMNYHLARLMQGKQSGGNVRMNKTIPQVGIRSGNYTAIEMSGRQNLFKSGEINECYRWCMEDMVEYGKRITILKTMVKCALLNEEYKLAQKYNTLISKTFFNRKWAQKYQRYIDTPELIENDAELKFVKSISRAKR